MGGEGEGRCGCMYDAMSCLFFLAWLCRWYPGRRVSVPALQLQCGGHSYGLGTDASGETHTLPRRIAPDQWDKIHHGILH